MKKYLIAALLLYGLSATGQDQTVKEMQAASGTTIKKEEDTIPRLWKTGGIFNLNLSQGSLSNWAAGGDNFSLSLNSILSAYAFYKKNKSSWDNTLDVNFGYIRTTTLGTRKNDDRFDVLSKYGH